MKILTVLNPNYIFNAEPSSSLLVFQFPSRNRTFLISSIRKWNRSSLSHRFSFTSLRASCVTSSTVYGGWDDVGIGGNSNGPGEFDALRNFLLSLGINDRKNVFVFILGLVCAMAISRVKVSSIIVLPASVLVFAVGFTLGFFRNGTFGDFRVSGIKRNEKEVSLKFSSEKLTSLLEFFDEIDLVVNKLKSDVQSAIKDNKIESNDLYGYVEVTDNIKFKALNARNVVKTLIDNEENSSAVLVDANKTGRKKKEVGVVANQMLQSIGNLFGEKMVSSNSIKVRENVKQEALDQSKGNGTVPPIDDRALNLVDDSKANRKLDSSKDSSDPVLDVDRNARMETITEKGNVGLGDSHRRTNKFPDEKQYSSQNKGLRFTNNHSFSLKMDSSSITDMWESNGNLLDSESVKVRMKHVESESSFVREQLLDREHETFRSSRDKSDSGSERSQYNEEKVNYDDRHRLADDMSTRENEFDTPPSAKFSDDMMFDRYLAEATDLLKQAKMFINGRHDEEQAEVMLYRTSDLLSKAVDLKPMSLLAVGQLGNTYLLHGELKLKISRELRYFLSGRIRSSSEKYSRILKGLQNKITSNEEVAPLLVDVCDECEQLLVEAGRKYRLALSIDANDVRALYNWGLALSFRGQLIADIGPGAAFEAERVFLAAIDKFDAMLLKGNVYAPDALFRWGVALQQRSRLRPGSSKEKVKLLQQARRLYEDALNMDSNNIQVKNALSSCVSELNFGQF
ncbi:hypothetical protein Lal_00040881 [Lupinus albus]|uniref:Putative tetratricopeptide-like helical domain-containing protein n=1 Tax=Lupinus albus TaxID=3870 RepID=A0A6A5NUH5_LUPAL|nr:putative tetratricopeptide-like helical domain-containing protein [Lupinus albus]KAF1887280.1 hypothetical protein Lal_00040881 [Lupinus albus]